MAMAKEAMKAPKAPEDSAKETSANKLARIEIEIHHDPKGNVSGHTVHHNFMPKGSKSGAFMERPESGSYSFNSHGHSEEHGPMMEHIGKHLGIEGGKGMIEAENKPGQDDDDEQSEYVG